jgi:hypothetical protein
VNSDAYVQQLNLGFVLASHVVTALTGEDTNSSTYSLDKEPEH